MTLIHRPLLRCSRSPASPGRPARPRVAAARRRDAWRAQAGAAGAAAAPSSAQRARAQRGRARRRRGRPARQRAALPAGAARQPGRPVGMGPRPRTRCSCRRAGRACSASSRTRSPTTCTAGSARVHPDDRAALRGTRWRATWRRRPATRASTTSCACCTRTAACARCCRAASRSARESGAPYRMVGLDTDVTRLQARADRARRGGRRHRRRVRRGLLPGHGAALRARARTSTAPSSPNAPTSRRRGCARSRYWSATSGLHRQLRVRARRHAVRRGRARRPARCFHRERPGADVPARGRLRGLPRHADHRQRRPRARPPGVLRPRAAAATRCWSTRSTGSSWRAPRPRSSACRRSPGCTALETAANALMISTRCGGVLTTGAFPPSRIQNPFQIKEMQ